MHYVREGEGGAVSCAHAGRERAAPRARGGARWAEKPHSNADDKIVTRNWRNVTTHQQQQQQAAAPLGRSNIDRGGGGGGGRDREREREREGRREGRRKDQLASRSVAFAGVAMHQQAGRLLFILRGSRGEILSSR